MYQQPQGLVWRSRLWTRRVLPALGPAFVAAIAYVDPGNFATNVSAGAAHGYLLVWVIVLANVVAMLVQYLSAKTGLATGLSLPALCRRELPRPVVRGLWAQAEIVSIATDVAEVVGGALALKILFDVPLLAGGLITATVAFVLLRLETGRQRTFEIAIAGLLGVMLLGFTYDLVLGAPHPADVAGGLVPRFDGIDSVVLASGMVGATVMPHAIYLHSSLTARRHRGRSARARLGLLGAQRTDVILAMSIAGLMNLSLLAIAAATLRGRDIDGLEAAQAAIERASGNLAGLAFAVALLISGFASSSVGTLSGQIVMEGFVQRRIPLWVRRLSSLAPAVLILALGADPTKALVGSQVVLSLGIPFALIPLVMFTRRHGVMGDFVNRRGTTLVASAVTAAIVALNLALVGALALG